MSFRFIHVADVHLGYLQYGSSVRYNDFARSFSAVIDDAIAHKVDFILVSGDLFHRRSLDPQTLYQAVGLLSPLHEHNIPLVAIIGNHENPHIFEGMSWPDYLNVTGQIILLDAYMKHNQFVIAPWDSKSRKGAFIDLPCGARIIGSRYYGASTPLVLSKYLEVLAALPAAPYSIFMLHAGLQGTLDIQAPSVTRAQLDPLRAYTDYIAMGHFHKPYEQDRWIYNPGSLETVSAEEVSWDDRGYLFVEVDPDRQPKHSVTHIKSKRRPFVRLSFPVDTYSSPTALMGALLEYAKQRLPLDDQRQPVIEITLRGALQFERSNLDLAAIEEQIKQKYNPLLVRIHDATTTNETDIDLPENQTRSELEHGVLQELVGRDARFRVANSEWASFITQIKGAALSSMPAEEIAHELTAFLTMHPLESSDAH
ncbi:MAG: metallophosphoesterase family protein [Anaerolineae bacterium]